MLNNEEMKLSRIFKTIIKFKFTTKNLYILKLKTNFSKKTGVHNNKP